MTVCYIRIYSWNLTKLHLNINVPCILAFQSGVLNNQINFKLEILNRDIGYITKHCQ